MSPERPHCMLGESLLERIIEVAHGTPAGNFAEVGVRHGGTSWELLRLALKQGRQMFCYDTFTGIPYSDPDKGDTHVVGDFGDADVNAVRAALEEATVVQGIFPASAVDMGPMAFVHLDCDQYQAVKESLEFFIPRMVPGGVIWMDDSGLLAGATRASEEVLGDRRETDPVAGKHFYRAPIA